MNVSKQYGFEAELLESGRRLDVRRLGFRGVGNDVQGYVVELISGLFLNLVSLNGQ